MPKRPPKPCANPGCPVLASAGHAYCDAHWEIKKKAMDEKAKESGREYYQNYASRKWREYRVRYLVLHPYCACGNPATTVDHIYSIRDGGSMWDQANHQPLCQECHSRKTAQANGGFGNKRMPGGYESL